MFGGGVVRFGGGDSGGGGGGGGGLPNDDVVITCGESVAFTFNRSFALCDGVRVIPCHVGNFGGTGSAAYFLDTGGGADADTMAGRLLTCLTATFAAASSDLSAVAGPGSDQVTVSAGATGLLVGTATAGLVLS